MPSVELGEPAQRELFEDLTGAQQVEQNPLLAKLQTIKSRLKQRVRSHMNKQAYLENLYLQIENQSKTLQAELKSLEEQKVKEQQFNLDLESILDGIGQLSIDELLYKA